MIVLGKTGKAGLAGIAAVVLLAGMAGFGRPAQAQSPISPPAVRFYGHTSVVGGRQLPVSTKIGADVTGQRCDATVTFPRAGLPNGISGAFTDNEGNYALDVQAVPGCTTAGATVDFSSGALKAQEHGTVPDLPGTAVHLDLTFQLPATPTPAATRAAPPPPPTTALPPAAPRATPAAPAAQGPRGAQGPREAQGPEKAQGPAKAAGGPAYQAPAYGAGGGAAIAATPQLPSTGTGGMLNQSAEGGNAWALAAVLLAAFGMGASGLAAYRRGR